MARMEISGPADQPVFKLTLSRRNLLALLHKLDMEGSARTIEARYVYANEVLLPLDAARVFLCCEDDAEHYIGRAPPGEMHPDTETFIAGGGEGMQEIT